MHKHSKALHPKRACVHLVSMPFPERGSMLQLLVDCRLPKAPLIFAKRDVSTLMHGCMFAMLFLCMRQ
jgi:hypothetical protein